jgi:ribosomal protein L30E
MKIFNASDNLERKSYLEGVITGGVILGFEKTIENKWSGLEKVLIAGSNNITRVYELLLKETQNQYEVMTFMASGKQSYAVNGFIELLKIVGQPCQKQF